jgi:hypothetical protein
MALRQAQHPRLYLAARGLNRALRFTLLGLVVVVATGCGSSKHESPTTEAVDRDPVGETELSATANTCNSSEAFSPPWVVGLNEAAGARQLRQAGLDVRTHLEASRSVAVGVTISQFPPRYQKVCKGFPITLSVSGGPAPPTAAARPVAPRHLAVASIAGRQPVVHLHASSAPCLQTEDNSWNCNGPALPLTQPTRLSVIRPGETLQLIPAKPLPTGTLSLLPPSVSYIAWRLCDQPPRSTLDVPLANVGFFRNGRLWTVRLPPGDYAVSLSVSWTRRFQWFRESGAIGLRVSRREQRRIIDAPSC